MSRAYRRAHREMRKYLKQFPDATAEEIAALRQWVKDGNSPDENGDGVYDDSCHTMDFINTLRFWDGMYQEWLEDPESFAERYLSSNYAADNTLNDFQEPGTTTCPSNWGLRPQTPGV